jgi:DNA-binding transcriptional regulator YdaS (Cro superfamily)
MKPKKSIAEVVVQCGGATALATLLGGSVKRQNIEYWIKVDEIPADHCPAIERAHGIRCEDLRRDLNWVRIPDEAWKRGRPLLDLAPPMSTEGAGQAA